MAEQIPLVVISGKIQQLPDGDTIKGASGARSIDPANVNAPAQVTTDLHDYDPAGFTCDTQVLCIDLDNNHDITGIAYKCDWQTLIISNDSDKDLKVKKEDNNSLAANRFTLDADVTIKSGQALEFFYNANKNRWFAIGSQF